MFEMFFLHAVQWLRGQIIDKLRGKRYIAKFKKLPIHAPIIKIKIKETKYGVEKFVSIYFP